LQVLHRAAALIICIPPQAAVGTGNGFEIIGGPPRFIFQGDGQEQKTGRKLRMAAHASSRNYFFNDSDRRACLMKFSEATTGRAFIIRLEDGEILHESIERFAREKGVLRASVIGLGGADAGSRLVVGPEDGRAARVSPQETVLDGVHEITGTGTIFPDAAGRPVLHFHAACGRGGKSVTGCVRRGVKTWHVMEVIVQELVNGSAKRLREPATGFELLQP
jgi:predicted DNA-binding protein with PD1-like motif